MTCTTGTPPAVLLSSRSTLPLVEQYKSTAFGGSGYATVEGLCLSHAAAAEEVVCDVPPIDELLGVRTEAEANGDGFSELVPVPVFGYVLEPGVEPMVPTLAP